MKVDAYIGESLYYLPANKVTNHDLERAGVYSSQKISEKIGVESRYVAGQDEFVSDMAVAVGLAFFEKYQLQREIIDTLILCTQSPDYLIPGPEYSIHQRLDLESDCKVISFNSGCSGFIYGLEIASSFIQSGKSKNILLITAETYSKHLSISDVGNRSIFGDAAAATLITAVKQPGQLKVDSLTFYTDGKGFNKIANPKSGMRGNSQGDLCGFEMQGADVYLFTISTVVEQVREFLSKNQLSIDDIDYFIFHQASKMVLDGLQKKLKISEDKFLKYYSEIGNTVSSTIPIVINRKLAGLDLSNKKVLLCGFGVGLSVGVALLEG
jgi:3-oxoacyl-[acyl-carrier-protein] synthase-3